MITHSLIDFKDLLASSIAPQVMPTCPTIVSTLATQQNIGGSQGENGKFECRLCCELLCILSWLQPYKKYQSWFQEKNFTALKGTA